VHDSLVCPRDGERQVFHIDLMVFRDDESQVLLDFITVDGHITVEVDVASVSVLVQVLGRVRGQVRANRRHDVNLF